MQFQVKTIKNENIKDELLKIGFDSAYIDYAKEKHEILNLKITNLSPHMATIIKETALSKGCDSGVHKDVLMHKIDKSDLILSGTIKQLKEVAKSLLNQPFGLKEISKLILDEINLKNKIYSPEIMGILNITDNSFSDGGKFLDEKLAIKHAIELINDGANIIDIGAESTKPNSSPIEIETEIKRLTPIVKELKNQNFKISIDTRNSSTASKMIEFGADIINDVSFLNYDNKMVDVIKNSTVSYVLTHSKGIPDNMDNFCDYKNLRDEIFEEIKSKIEELKEIDKNRLIIDVGFGFAKNIEQNFELLKNIKEFNSLNYKTLAGVSRKRFLKSLVKSNDNEILDEITMLSSFYLFENKVDIIRVHNAKKTKLALDFYNSIY